MLWKDRLEKYLKKSPINVDEAYKRSYKFTGNEPGIVHPITKSSVKLRDDGCIDLFAGQGLGIRIDPNAGSVNVFADKFNVWSSTTSIHTNDNDFMWNYWPFNPELYRHIPWQRNYIPYNYMVKGKRLEWDQLYGWQWKDFDMHPFLPNREKSMLSEGSKKMLKNQNVALDVE